MTEKKTSRTRKRSKEVVRILKGALDELDGTDDIILRGVIHPDDLHMIKFDHYQREIMPLSTINALAEAIRTGSVPDVELGMRGGTCEEVDGVFILCDPVYGIDGQQRITAGLQLISSGSGKKPHLGATIHFGTTEEWERHRFHVLNALRAKLSPNVLLRNMRCEYSAIDMIHQMSSSPSFVLKDRICWNQRMNRQELLTAVTFVKTIGMLHSHIGPGKSGRIVDLARQIHGLMEKVGKNIMRDNTKALFDLVDEAWGVKRVAFKEKAIWMRSNFLYCLSSMLSNHTDFWTGSRLIIKASARRKIAKFPVNDPQIISLAGGSGKSKEMLYMLMVQDFNKGKRTGRLSPRDCAPPVIAVPDLGESEK